jgi:hypothetical protein
MEKTTKILMKEMREEIAKEIEAIDLGGTSQINALGMKIIAAEIARNLFNEKDSNRVEYKN